MSSGAGAGFRIVTDSTSDIPADWRERYRIEVVPLNVLFGKESFRDNVDLSNEHFFTRLAEARQLPTTSAPAPGEFAAVYERLSRECSGVISIHLGSSLSGTVESARIGARSVDGFPVHVIDSGSTTMAAGFLCQVAAESASLEEAVGRCQERLPRLRIIALLDTLRYIEMGGRVSRTQAMLGSMLDLKPILGVAGGQIRSLARVRTRSRAIPRMLELLRGDAPLERVAVVHAQAPAEAERIRAELVAELSGFEILSGPIGCVLGTHTGPGALGLAYVRA